LTALARLGLFLRQKRRRRIRRRRKKRRRRRKEEEEVNEFESSEIGK
jgi:hypothetical protein